MMRYFKKCEEFAICSEVGESNFLFPETSDECSNEKSLPTKSI